MKLERLIVLFSIGLSLLQGLVIYRHTNEQTAIAVNLMFADRVLHEQQALISAQQQELSAAAQKIRELESRLNTPHAFAAQ